MSLRRQVLGEILTWVETTLGITGAGSAPQVILSQRGEKGPRPPLPYLTLNFTTWDEPTGVDETFHPDVDSRQSHGQRMATLEIRGFGEGADDWIQELALLVGTYEGPGTIINQGGGVLDVSALVSDTIEHQFLREFPFEYGVHLESEFPTALESTVTVRDMDETITITTVTTWS